MNFLKDKVYWKYVLGWFILYFSIVGFVLYLAKCGWWNIVLIIIPFMYFGYLSYEHGNK